MHCLASAAAADVTGLQNHWELEFDRAASGCGGGRPDLQEFIAQYTRCCAHSLDFQVFGCSLGRLLRLYNSSRVSSSA